MSTTLLNAEVALSKDIGDYWASATTTNGADATFDTMIDSALIAKANDWITDETWVMLTEEPAGGTTSLYEERKVSSLSNTLGTLTVLAFTERIVSGIDYRLHRLFKPSDKKIALIAAAKNIFPSCFQEVWDESLVSGNWLKDGSFERWTSATALTDWTTTTSTLAQTSTSPYYKHGGYSCKLSTAAGKIAQGITNFDDLKRLAGKTVTFSVQGWCNTASCLRIQIYDGTTTTTSDYHDGSSTWTENNDPMEIQVQIADNPTEITFRILHDVAAGISYIDDARVISGYRGRTYIRQLGLTNDRPHQVFIEPTDYSQEEDWYLIRDWKIDKDGYLYIPTAYPSDRRLRIRGIGYLDFFASGASSTDWAAEINLSEPQIKILSAEAALYLYTWMSMPNFESGTRADYQQMMQFWAQETAKRKAQFGMKSPPATIHWG